MTPEVCPHCGADIPPNVKVCPECGSDEETGWSEEARYHHLDLPDEKFDYGDFVEREFAEEGSAPRGIHWFWWLVAILLVVAMFYMWLR